jgi:hypothetical protein
MNNYDKIPFKNNDIDFFGKKRYKNFKESLPPNLSQTNEKEYAMKRYWKDSGKPKDFNEAQNKENPMFYETYEPELNKSLYHGVSVSEKTGKFYKRKSHSSTYKELEEYKSNPELQGFREKTKLVSRGKNWKYKEKSNRELTNPIVSERVNKRTERNIEKGIKLSKNANR